VHRAWTRTLVITPHTDTGLPSSPVISAFKKTGIWPYSRGILDTDIFSASDHYKTESDKAGKAGAPTPARPKLTLDDSALASVREQVLKVDKSLPPDLAARVKASSRTRMAELLTSDEWLEKEVQRNATRDAEENAAKARRDSKAAAKAERGGLTLDAWRKAQKAAAAAAAAAAAPAAPPPPLPPPPVAPILPPAAPKKAARPRQHKAAAGDVYAKA